METQQKSAAKVPNQTATMRPFVFTNLLQRKCACGGSPGLGGECAECTHQMRLGLQTKLKADEPGDLYEREADRIADKVMAASAQAAVSGSPLRVQRVSENSSAPRGEVPVAVEQVLASAGRPLEPALLQEMEQRFGHDFSRVRVHTDAAAEQSARAVSARAYTVGADIVFGRGHYAPGAMEGKKLLAHELTHVLQQAGGHEFSLGLRPSAREASSDQKLSTWRLNPASRW